MASVVHDFWVSWDASLMASVVHDRLFGCLGMRVRWPAWCTTDFLGVLGCEFDGQRGARQTFWVSWDASLMASMVHDRLFGCLGMRV